jgi:hypothetical protein
MRNSVFYSIEKVGGIMRRMKWLDYTDEDTQQCLINIHERLGALGVSEQDVISVQHVWNDDPVPIIGGDQPKHGNVTIFVFYWSD